MTVTMAKSGILAELAEYMPCGVIMMFPNTIMPAGRNDDVQTHHDRRQRRIAAPRAARYRRISREPVR
ncbi:hypothetical protein, partial [Noviherbaspirillum denitrificans]|uniref:hypothetical protein n=1 Tax=Noviherbaspirillum denitrificans TaxID=1968433 RepID=UPI00197F9516